MPGNSSVINVVVAGLGGQGVLKASGILADAAFRAGLDVKKSEIHGMSQRGGSVSSDVRFGSRVFSPMVPAGEADFLVVLAASQIEVARPVLKADGVLVHPGLVDEARLANKRSLNVALLGALARHLNLADNLWHAAIEAALPEKLHAANLQAFAIGKNS
ncbi:MAG TPA: 2-oxoacid:acceptor oxidoreductase family protein [Polyangia bacterium]|jgi:Pyruvate:ferredoxin oxidoreductase and related 2-oxoacid:ferredoxin oxidoreductases, gamma subunit|nr:2-oxoacid:acceptor oxidoreductase family protein [Polyangia bacterium]